MKSITYFIYSEYMCHLFDIYFQHIYEIFKMPILHSGQFLQCSQRPSTRLSCRKRALCTQSAAHRLRNFSPQLHKSCRILALQLWQSGFAWMPSPASKKQSTTWFIKSKHIAKKANARLIQWQIIIVVDLIK